MGVPTSTYRLQIRSGFELTAAAQLCEYLSDLGVGAVYCSPLLQAAAGSDHGYDVVDHDVIDPARGGATGWQALRAATRSHGLGLVVDIVPNHVGVGDAAENRVWWDVLRLGRDSPFAHWFDIDWSRGRILLPVLGDAVSPSELSVVGDELRYYEHRFPLRPATEPGTPAEVHHQQHYELVNFRQADTQLNYRRFFAVTSLAGLRVEDNEVFDPTHREILRWVHEDGIDGLRIDHPDGLADPLGYLVRLQAAAPATWITVEKILEPGEQLPVDWPVAGTTGYDALTEVTNVLVDPAGGPALDALYRKLTSDERDFAEHVEAGKRHVASTILRSEVARLARLAPDVPDADEAVAELLVAFPVYRSYLPLGAGALDEAVERAVTRRPDLAAAVRALLPRLADPADELCVRFQQTSGAVMAKGVEDTAYYRYTRMLALNEVGGDPARIGASLDDFHTAQRVRQHRAPLAMTTLSTHDTKRSEDVRAGLAVLAELPDEWAALASILMDSLPLPDRSIAYLIWQTFVGAGLIAPARMHAYVEKAMREASTATQWVDPSEPFEDAVHAAIDRVYEDAAIRGPIEQFLSRIEPFAWSNALSQKLIGLTTPGVPDVYQATELWDDSLVDPDNRRAVDFVHRAGLLRSLDAAGMIPRIDASGAAKLWVTSRALRLRRDRPDLFCGYRALHAEGPAADHVVAFDRGGAITVATRLPAGLAAAGGWRDTTLELPAGMINILDDRRVLARVGLRELMSELPVALLAPASVRQ